MPDRLNRVEIKVGDVVVHIPWETRTLLLERLRDHGSPAAKAAIVAFQGVGATRPVELGPAELRALFEVVGPWFDDLRMMCPTGVERLRRALVDDQRAVGW